ncbi:MAG: hypothetical protein ACOZDY_12615 [Pseudomonadota bacterium]
MYDGTHWQLMAAYITFVGGVDGKRRGACCADRQLATGFVLRGAPRYGHALFAVAYPRVEALMRKAMRTGHERQRAGASRSQTTRSSRTPPTAALKPSTAPAAL